MEVTPFDEMLFERCFWHFIDKTETSDRVAVELLKKLLMHSTRTPQDAQKLMREAFIATGVPWKSGPSQGTPVQDMKFLANGIYRLYGIESAIRYELANAKNAGVTGRRVCIEARPGCRVHAADHGRIVDFREYWAKKPMAREFSCLCTLDWEPMTERQKARWLQRAERMQQENR